MKGFLFILSNIIVASLQSVLLSHWLSGINVFLIISMSFTIVLAIYASFFLLKGMKYIKNLKGMKKEIILLNITSACNWIFYFFSIKYVNPAAVVTITQCMPAVFTSIYLVVRGEKLTVTTIFFHALILLCTMYFVQDYLSKDGVIYGEAMFGISMALLCALTVALTIVISRGFSEKKVPTYVVLSIRFPLLITLAWIMTPLADLQSITLNQMCIILFTSVIGLACANFFLQKGIEYATPLMVSTTLAISPAVVLLFERIYVNDYSINNQSYVILVIVILSLCCIYLNSKKSQALMPKLD